MTITNFLERMRSEIFREVSSSKSGQAIGLLLEENQFLLVYEYLPKGSLENHLFSKGEALTWDTRLKIAIEAAQGLTFLHNSEKSVIYRDFKASNILLDSNFHAKLSDFGLAKNGPINGFSHVTTRVMGTQGYAAPNTWLQVIYTCGVMFTGFGVVLLELLTGLRALDPTRPSAQQNLVEWAKPVLTQKKKIQKMMDPRLEQNLEREHIRRIFIVYLSFTRTARAVTTTHEEAGDKNVVLLDCCCNKDVASCWKFS
ncbi:probable serine/threonine-protein kinase PIX13 [Raphanus sativus]|uniref:non-specific serine/threonine protein kinase n=1 Tax=Raphanus sativus TaxID=3726 RepID=A0A9W3C7A3_RAPSA|nr:probable serine/threonine-protein kinase PIX13 [Raphanus sativus]